MSLLQSTDYNLCLTSRCLLCIFVALTLLPNVPVSPCLSSKSNSAAIHELGDLQLAPQSECYADIVNNAEVQDETLTPEVTSAIYKLWNEDEAIRECVSRSREFQLNDSAP